MYQDQFADLSKTTLPIWVIEQRLRSARQALVTVAGRDETWSDTVRSSLRTTGSDVGHPPRARVLCDRSWHETMVSRQAPLSHRMEVCVVDEVPFQFTVLDGETAFTFTGGTPVELRGDVAVGSLTKFFESLWRSSELPSRPSDDGADGVEWTDEVQLAIIKRLVNGDTEDKIGRSLGISRRTVAAHVARISRRLGSTSRTQLGYLIAQGNFLDSFDDSELGLLTK